MLHQFLASHTLLLTGDEFKKASQTTTTTHISPLHLTVCHPQTPTKHPQRPSTPLHTPAVEYYTPSLTPRPRSARRARHRLYRASEACTCCTRSPSTGSSSCESRFPWRWRLRRAWSLQPRGAARGRRGGGRRGTLLGWWKHAESNPGMEVSENRV